ncbi:hypothetical protein [Nonomuraea sp. NPDC049480]|uniref:hypothetical protein n=1 Tax=Nonomuraea sp. NPDC049480 TaxID=3364353 RepID=UPI0037969148
MPSDRPAAGPSAGPVLLQAAGTTPVTSSIGLTSAVAARAAVQPARRRSGKANMIGLLQI